MYVQHKGTDYPIFFYSICIFTNIYICIVPFAGWEIRGSFYRGFSFLAGGRVTFVILTNPQVVEFSCEVLHLGVMM